MLGEQVVPVPPLAEQRRLVARIEALTSLSWSAGFRSASAFRSRSAVLSNIYMRDFDVAVARRVQAVGGLYRRYCDDMLCVVLPEHAAEIEAFVMAEIHRVKLDIQTEKTKRHHFTMDGARLRVDEPLQYLGFIFDGRRALLRTSSVSRYYHKMRAAVSLAVQTKRKHDGMREKRGEPKEPLKRRKLNIRYSYIGRHNFISYAIRAAKKMNEPAIRRQVKRHWKKLNAEVDNAQAKVRTWLSDF